LTKALLPQSEIDKGKEGRKGTKQNTAKRGNKNLIPHNKGALKVEPSDSQSKPNQIASENHV